MRIRKAKQISLLLILTILATMIPWQAAKAQTPVPEVSAHAYVVIDANSGEVLFSENESKKIYPASTAKLMTAIVALEKSALSKKIITKQSVLSELPNDATMIGLKPKKTYSVNQLLQMTLIVSAADAANTIAAGVSGTTKKFVKQMNTKAELLGLSDTSFDNVVGLDIGNGYKKTYTTASDMGVIARYAMSNKTIRDIVSMKTYTVPKSIKSSTGLLKSTNLFYSTADYSKDRYTIIGTKTGTTNAAGAVLIATAKDSDNHEVICAFFGDVNRVTTYQDVRKLLDYTFEQFDNGDITLNKGFYDIRFRSSESTIIKYCNEDILTGDKNGAFSPDAKIGQKEFVDTVNRIAGTQFTAVSNQKVTILDLAELLMKSYPFTVSADTLMQWNGKFTSKNTLTDENVKNLVALYISGILPKEYQFNADSYITKEDMVLIGDKLPGYIASMATNPSVVENE